MISHATVHRRLKAPNKTVRIGAKRKLGFVEECFVVQHLIMKGVRMTYGKANDEIIKIVTRAGRSNPFKTTPSTGFWRGLIKRHPALLQVVGVAKKTHVLIS